MSKKPKEKETGKKLQRYLSMPSGETVREVIALDYIPVLESMLQKLSTARLGAAIDLLATDGSEAALSLMADIAARNEFPIELRKKAADTVTDKSGKPPESIDAVLLDRLVRVAENDDAEKAVELVGGLDGDTTASWIDLLTQKNAVRTVAALGRFVDDKRTQKLLKKAAYKMRARGNDIPDWEARGESVLRPREKEKPLSYATISDGMGATVIYIQAPTDISRTLVVIAVSDEAKGLTDFQALHATRGSARDFIKHIRETAPSKFYDVPIEFATWTLSRAASRTSRTGGRVPPEYLDVKDLLREYFGDYDPPDPEELIGEAPRMSDELNSVDLLDDPAFQTWMPTEEMAYKCKEKLDLALQSTLVISEAQRMEQIDKAFEDSARSYLDEGARDLLVLRLANAARLYAWNGEKDGAKKALAAALEIGKPGGAPRFVVEMFRRLFPDIYDIAAQADGGGPPEPEPEKSGGGIIIP